MPSRARFHHSHRGVTPRRIGRLSTGFARSLFVLSLLFLPLFWGGNHPFSMGYAILSVLSVCFFWLMGGVLQRRLKVTFPTGIIFFAPAVAILLLQLSTTVFQLFSTEAVSQLWRRGSWIVSAKPVLAVMPDQQIPFIVFLSVVVVFYFLGAELFYGSRRAIQLVFAVFCAATLSSLLGLCEHFAHLDWLTYVDGKSASVVRGGYLNRNHFAQLCSMGYFCGIGLFVSLLGAKTGSALASRFDIKARVCLMAFIGIASVSCFLAVIFSYSRTAILAMGFGTLLLTSLLAVTRMKRYLSVPILTAIFALFLGAFYGLEPVISRVELAISGSDPSGLVRLEIWRVVLEAIRYSPIFGSGAAAVQALTPLFDTSFTPGKIAFDAHNDYLELAAVFGVPFALALTTAILFFVVRTGGRLWRQRHTDSSYYPVAVALFVGLIAALVHEGTDYGFKHVANLVVFSLLSVALSEFITHFENHSNDRFLPYQRFELSVAGRIACTVCAVVTMAAVAPYAVSRIQLGETLLQVQNLVTSSAVKTAMKPEERLELIRDASLKALAIEPSNQEARFARLQASLDLADEREAALVAEVLTRRFDRPISAKRARSNTYRPYWIESIRSVDEKEKRSVYALLETVQKDATELAQKSPSNAIELSIVAMAKDHQSAFSSTPINSLTLHHQALRLYPWHVDILKRALRAATVADTQKIMSDDALTTYARRLCAQTPQELSWVLPILWSRNASTEILVSVTPETITAQELLARFLLDKNEVESALGALERMETLNAARFDVETPESMGSLAYLAREKRDKNIVFRDIERMRVKAYTVADRQVERVASEEKLAQLEETVTAPLYEQIDRWMADGQWILARETVEDLPKTADRLVREAEIAYAIGSFRRAKRLLAELAWLPQGPKEILLKRVKGLEEKLNRNASQEGVFESEEEKKP